MKILRLLIFLLILPPAIFLSGCEKEEPYGGALPVIEATGLSDDEINVEDTPYSSAAPLVPEPPPQAVGAAESSQPSTPGAVGDDRPLTRAEAAKMLALMNNDMNTIRSTEYEINFSDVSPGSWYAPYINAVCVQGVMAGMGETFAPEGALTLGQAARLLEQDIALTDANRDKPVSYALWCEMYRRLLDGKRGADSVYDAFGIQAASLIVMATSGNSPALSPYQTVTDIGAFTHDGLDLNDYADREVRVLVKNKEIVALLSVVSTRPTIRNAYINAADENTLSVFSGGAERRYAYAPECAVVPADHAGKICDITVEGGVAYSVEVFPETVTGTILKTASGSVELKELGVIPADAAFKVYGVESGAVKWKSAVNLLSGTDMAVFHMKDGVIRAGVIQKEVQPSRIRVALSTSGFGGLIHGAVSITSDNAFTVTSGETVTQYEAGEIFTVSESAGLFGQSRVYITPSRGGALEIVNLSRNWPEGTNPRYRGSIEIAREEGGFSVVNELPIEEYLYAVVPSEMPSSYGAEASKAQAVTARSYAYNQIFENRCHAFGAHVDDSVNSQVYNNIPENGISVEAVDATRGLCLTYGSRVISANFFSTSSGHTANSGEVWASPDKFFPQATPEYLRAKPQSENGAGNLSDENTAAAFFKDVTINAYDSGFNWFRWNVSMTAGELSASINNRLYERWQASPSLIKTWQSDEGVFRSRPVETIGALTGLTVIKRGEGGNIMELRIDGTENTVLVSTEYNIRALLAPAKQTGGTRDIHLNRKDGTYVSNYSLMPSAFFTFEKETDGYA
ncbi:MAG: SpoIID/LytB domain-containing protein, partial [Clostridiales bacterium]|nr:SpoIID/LytB domain-containing protein [Clostridiales bacterium]